MSCNCGASAWLGATPIAVVAMIARVEIVIDLAIGISFGLRRGHVVRVIEHDAPRARSIPNQAGFIFAPTRNTEPDRAS